MDDRIHVATGDEITNPRTGQRMIFRRTGDDTDGRELIIECWSPRLPEGEAREPMHVHPGQEKRFRMIDGELTVSINGETRTRGPGDEVVVPSDAVHSFWNDREQEAHYWQEFRRALRSAEFFATLFALAREGKLGARGILNMAAMARRFRHEIMVASPPPWAQQIVFGPLAQVARLAGTKAEMR